MVLKPVPDVIPPCSDKIDFEKLRREIPKFFNSRTFTDEHKAWWKDFLEDKNGLFVAREQPLAWLLDDVPAIKEQQIAEETPQSEPCVTAERLGLPQRPLDAPKDVEDMVVAQFCEIPQVSKTLNDCYSV